MARRMFSHWREHFDVDGRPLPMATAGRATCGFLLLSFIVVIAYLGGTRLFPIQPDFEYFYKSGRSLLTVGTFDPPFDRLPGGNVGPVRGTLEWYLPFVPRVMTVIAWLPSPAAAAVWLAGNLAALLGTLRMIGRRLSDHPPADWPATQLLPLLLLALFWYWEFRLNQINTLTLLLIVASFVSWEAGRRGIAGFWLGLATLIKLTPALLIIWFLLKRQFRTAAVAAIVILLAGPVGDTFAFGPREAAEQWRTWVRNAAAGGSAGGLILSQREMDWRNQAVGAVLSRWLHHTSWTTHWDNDPRWYNDEPAYFNIAGLPRQQVALLATAVTVASAAALLWIARRPAVRMSTWGLRLEWALFVAAMLWFMPVMRRYHLIWLFPAVSLLGAAASRFATRRRPISICVLVLLSLVPLCELATYWRIAEAGGMLLLAVLIVMSTSVLALHALVQRPAAVTPAGALAAGAPRPGERAPAGEYAAHG